MANRLAGQASLEGLCFIASSGCFCLFICLILQILCVYSTASSFVFLWIFCVCKCACLCIHMCFLCFFSWTLFFPVWLFCLIPVSFVFCFILSPFYYYSLDEGETERGSGGVTGRGMGGGKHNLNILYEKKNYLFSVLKKKPWGG